MINNNKIIKTSLDKNGDIVLHYLNNKNEIKKTTNRFTKLAPLKKPYYNDNLNNIETYYNNFSEFKGGNKKNDYNDYNNYMNNWSNSDYNYEEIYNDPDYKINLDKIENLDYNEMCFKY